LGLFALDWVDLRSTVSVPILTTNSDELSRVMGYPVNPATPLYMRLRMQQFK